MVDVRRAHHLWNHAQKVYLELPRRVPRSRDGASEKAFHGRDIASSVATRRGVDLMRNLACEAVAARRSTVGDLSQEIPDAEQPDNSHG